MYMFHATMRAAVRLRTKKLSVESANDVGLLTKAQYIAFTDYQRIFYTSLANLKLYIIFGVRVAIILKNNDFF